MDHRDKSRWKAAREERSDRDRDPMDHREQSRWKPAFGEERSSSGARGNAIPGAVGWFGGHVRVKSERASPTLDDFEPAHHRGSQAESRRREQESPDHTGRRKWRRLGREDRQRTRAPETETAHNVKREDEAPGANTRAPEPNSNDRDQMIWHVKNDDDSIDDFAKELQKMGARAGASHFEIKITTIAHVDEVVRVPQSGADKPCAHCHSTTHTLADCPKPNPVDGYIPGCPNCNTMEHLFDDCKVTKSYYKPGKMDIDSLKYFLHVLVERRHNKPGIMSSKVCWMNILRQLYDGRQERKLACQGYYPWTINYSHRMIGAEPNDSVMRGKIHWDNWVMGVHEDDDLLTDPLFLRGGKIQIPDALINKNRNLRPQTIHKY